jgi:co-chaperonin GroES (HSP10)
MFQPLNDLVLIQTIDAEDGTIIRPDVAIQATSRGIVRGMSKDLVAQGILAEGDTVMFNPHGATDVPDMKGFVLIAYPELLGVWKEEPAKVKSART